MRDCTYIAADFDHDKPAVDFLYWMRENGYLTFKDAHDLQQSNDDSYACSIKKSVIIPILFQKGVVNYARAITATPHTAQGMEILIIEVLSSLNVIKL